VLPWPVFPNQNPNKDRVMAKKKKAKKAKKATKKKGKK
jgi:hypothetical protein